MKCPEHNSPASMSCMHVSVLRHGGMTLAATLCCPVGFGGWEYLLVKEGYLLTTDGQRILVKKNPKT